MPQYANFLVRARALGITALLAVLMPAAAGAESLLLIEADSGKVLQADNATMPWYPASTTKLMTTYVTLKAVRSGRITLDTLLTVSPVAAGQAPSKMGFKAGTQITVDNALKMLMVKSANDMAVVLAEGVSGSIDGFSDLMNQASQRLGMTQSSWVNPNGLPADGQITSARDMAILARALIRELPEYDFYWHIPAIKFGRRVIRNYNTLIGRYPGADGMKTGFICASGFNLVGSATRDGKRLITVVFGAPSGPVRAAKAAAMLEQGFAGNGLSWLMPSLGTVEGLTPIAATPPNLREEMCGKHRRRPAAEEADDTDEPAQANGDTGSAVQAFMLSNLKGSMPKPSSLIGPLVDTQPPIPVFVGPAKTVTHTTIAATPAVPGINAARQAAQKPAAAALAPALAARTTAPVVLGAKPLPAPKPKPAAAKPAPQQANAKPATPAGKAKPVTAAKPAPAAKPAATQAKAKPQADKKPAPAAAAQQAKAMPTTDKPKPAAQ